MLRSFFGMSATTDKVRETKMSKTEKKEGTAQVEDVQGEASQMDDACDSTTNNTNKATEQAHIFFRKTLDDDFGGPFTEQEVQDWYRQGWFYSALQFHFGEEGQIISLDQLRRFNGCVCPFTEPTTTVSFYEDTLVLMRRELQAVHDKCGILESEVVALQERNALLSTGLSAARDMVQSQTILNNELLENNAAAEQQLSALFDWKKSTEVEMDSMWSENEELKEKLARVEKVVVSLNRAALTTAEIAAPAKTTKPAQVVTPMSTFAAVAATPATKNPSPVVANLLMKSFNHSSPLPLLHPHISSLFGNSPLPLEKIATKADWSMLKTAYSAAYSPCEQEATIVVCSLCNKNIQGATSLVAHITSQTHIDYCGKYTASDAIHFWTKLCRDSK